MDWLQFWSSVIGSVAWPIAVFATALLFRNQIAALLRRLAELTLPGGYKLKFQEALQESRVALEEAEETPEVRHVGRARTRDHASLGYSANYDALLESISLPVQMLANYEALVEIIKEVRRARNLSEQMSAVSVLRHLEKEGEISTGIVEAFQALVKARNALVHLPSRAIEPNEAIEFVSQSLALSQILKGISNKKETPPKRG